MTRLGATEAEDVVAEVFAIAWRKGEVPDEPRAWLFAIARGVLANQVRTERDRTRPSRRAVARHALPRTGPVEHRAWRRADP